MSNFKLQTSTNKQTNKQIPYEVKRSLLGNNFEKRLTINAKGRTTHGLFFE